MHIQIANRLYYYTGNKAFPKFPTQSPKFYSPSLLLWSQQSTFRITTITNRHRTTYEITESVWLWKGKLVLTQRHTNIERKENCNWSGCTGQAKSRLIYNGEKSLSCRWEEKTCQSMRRFRRRRSCSRTAKASTKKTSGFGRGRGKAWMTSSIRRFELMDCLPLSLSSVIVTNTGFLLSNPN